MDDNTKQIMTNQETDRKHIKDIVIIIIIIYSFNVLRTAIKSTTGTQCKNIDMTIIQGKYSLAKKKLKFRIIFYLITTNNNHNNGKLLGVSNRKVSEWVG